MHADKGKDEDERVRRTVRALEVTIAWVAGRYATMLCFDVKVERDAQELAEDLGVRIYTADIIYHLFDAFTAYMKVRSACLVGP
jgi:translation initiation factor IF-2